MINGQTGLNGVEGPFAVANIDLVVEDRVWAYGQDFAERIATHFSAYQRHKPALFNGPMMLMDWWRLDGDTFYGRLCRTDFASFLYWRDAHAAGKLADLAGARNIFGTAAVRSSEGYLLVGEMSRFTANAGRLYPPCGSLDASDVTETGIDIDGSMARELAEETGLDLGGATSAPEYLIWFDGPRVAVVREYRYLLEAPILAADVRAFLARDPAPELRAIHFLSGMAALDAVSAIEGGAVPDYTKAMVRWFFGRD